MVGFSNAQTTALELDGIKKEVDSFIAASPSVRAGVISPDQLKQAILLSDEIGWRTMLGLGGMGVGVLSILAMVAVAAVGGAIIPAVVGLALAGSGSLISGLVYSDAIEAKKKLTNFTAPAL